MHLFICMCITKDCMMASVDVSCKCIGQLPSRSVTKNKSGIYQAMSTSIRRKFWSQTSANMDSWKSRGGKSQGGEEKKWEDQRREREQRKKMQVHEKVGKSQLTLSFQWFVALCGRRVGSLKRRVRSQLARWEMKSCTQLWCGAHFQVKMYKAYHVQHTFGSWEVEKLHAFVARSAFPNQKSQKLTVSESRNTFGRWDVEKVHTN